MAAEPNSEVAEEEVAAQVAGAVQAVAHRPYRWKTGPRMGAGAAEVEIPVVEG